MGGQIIIWRDNKRVCLFLVRWVHLAPDLLNARGVPCSLKSKRNPCKGPPRARPHLEKRNSLVVSSLSEHRWIEISDVFTSLCPFIFLPSWIYFPLVGPLTFFSSSFSHVRINDLPVYPRHLPSADQACLGRSYMAYCNY